MPLSVPEIRHRALGFAREFSGETRERAEASTFWNAFFDVFGISRRRVASFEVPVKKAGGRQGYIDLLWKGLLLVEHKSRGESLDRAARQARDYFPGLQESELPRYLLVSDFARFRLYDLDAGTDHEFALAELPARVQLFNFLNGYYTKTYPPEDPANARAAELLGKLHDGLRAAGYGQQPYTAHYLEVLLVRLLFCCFAEDTGIFEKDQFREFLEERTRPDGTDTGLLLQQFFQVLDTPEAGRVAHLAPVVASLPYVNGALFREMLPLPDFTAALRELLLACTRFNWERISPAVFGSLFQAVADPVRRRTLGAHYTSETNILKVIGPLFLDELKADLTRAGRHAGRLDALHRRLAALRLLDPSCGCGNFLVVAYRELRLLELALLRTRYCLDLPVPAAGLQLPNLDILALVRVTQCAGLELEEFPARVAEVAMWLMDHQLNRQLAAEFGQPYLRLPLVEAAHIVHANALTTNWETTFPGIDYLLGNPPFVGAMWMSATQRQELLAIAEPAKGLGVVDYVAAWYLKAAQYMQRNPTAKAAFVSTNSITQGEQVGLLWGELLTRYHLHIQFAHRTFAWSNEARGKAAVHCIVVGFGLAAGGVRQLYDYETPTSEPHLIPATNINPYLVDGPNILPTSRSTPISNVPRMSWGSQPRDGGHFVFTAAERAELLANEPGAAKWLRPYVGGYEFINNVERWCLWLVGIAPDELQQLPTVLHRVAAVRQSRLASKAPSTQKLAARPTLFAQLAQPGTAYLAVPEVSSQRRTYIPIGFLPAEVIASNKLQTVPDATPFLFGVLSSRMHMTWMRHICGRLKSDYSYSNSLVYNNYPFPPAATPAQTKAVETAAEAVLATRAQFATQSLAALYDPLTMPPALAAAHATLDRAVDRCYRPAAFTTELARLEFLFALYQQLAAPLLPVPTARRRMGKAG